MSTSVKIVEVNVSYVRPISRNPGEDTRYLLVTDQGDFKTDPEAGTSYYLHNDFSVGTPIHQAARLYLTGGDRYKVADWRLVE